MDALGEVFGIVLQDDVVILRRTQNTDRVTTIIRVDISEGIYKIDLKKNIKPQISFLDF
jgi:hypothetical protein